VTSPFPPLDMLAYNRAVRQWATQSRRTVRPLHNSEPEPLAATEFEALTGLPLNALVKNTSLSYAPDAGNEALRTALANSMPGLTPDHVICTAGAQEGLTLVLHALIKPHDKAVVITPVFEPILRGLQGLEARIHTVPLQAQADQWQLDLNQLFDAMGADCKALVVNFPHNPTGALLSSADWQDIISQCQKHGTWLISDEVFRGLEQNSAHRLTPAAARNERGISLGVTAKSLALPGVRVGWIACQDRALRQEILAIKQYFSICNSQLDEAVATATVHKRHALWQRSTAIAAENSRAVEHALEVAFDQRPANKPLFIPPQGGCTGFMLLNGAHKNDGSGNAEDFCHFVLERTGLHTYPGHLFASILPGFRLGLGYRHFAEHYAALAEALALWHPRPG